MSELLGPMFGGGEHTSDRAWVQAMLDVEAAVARASASPAHADAIVAACDVSRFDLAELGASAAASASPVVPLVDALRGLVGDAAESVHVGITSQDVIDTATMLVARKAREGIVADARAAADSCARLADDHRRTVMPGRTLLQHAMPITFGLKAAGWTVALDDALALLSRWRPAVQAGGPVGAGINVEAAVAADLGLDVPVLPWHTNRVRTAELAGALGAVCGVAAKVAHDIVLLAQTEVGEVSEGEAGRSSSMPRKRNPARSVQVVATARRAPGLVGTIYANMDHEHERGAGSWQAEWETLRDLLRITGGAASGLRHVLDGLGVNASRMRENTGNAQGNNDELIDRALAAHATRR